MRGRAKSEGEPRGRARDGLFVGFVCAALLALLLGALARAPRGADGGGVGRARNVDMERIERKIGQGALSDHEAEFYRRVDSGEPGAGLPAPGE